MFNRIRAITVSVVMSTSFCIHPGLADTTPPGPQAEVPSPQQDSPPNANAAQQSAAPEQTSLHGGVQKIELNLEQLRDIGLDLKNVLKGLSSLYDEVTAQPMSLVTQPEVVGRGIVINIPIAAVPAGPRPPARKKRVDQAMSTVTPLVTVMKDGVDEFVSGRREIDLPPQVMDQIRPQLKQWVALVNNTSSQLSTLQQLTQGPPYNNDAIADTVVAMEKNVKSMDETRRAVYKVIRKEGKKLAQPKTAARP